jgi:hypothetical protein
MKCNFWPTAGRSDGIMTNLHLTLSLGFHLLDAQTLGKTLGNGEQSSTGVDQACPTLN